MIILDRIYYIKSLAMKNFRYFNERKEYIRIILELLETGI